MVEDYNSVAKFKSEVVAHLDEYENMWSSKYPDYKPYISYVHSDSVNEKLESLDELNIHDDRQIADQYPFALHILSLFIKSHTAFDRIIIIIKTTINI